MVVPDNERQAVGRDSHAVIREAKAAFDSAGLANEDACL